MKVDVNTVAEVLKKDPTISPASLRRVIEELNLAAQPEPGEEKAPVVKKQFTFLLSDPEGKLAKQDFVGWILQLPESESVATVQDRIIQTAYDYNQTRKGQLLPVSTIGEALECIKAGSFKEKDLWVKTKVPVLVLRTDNAIPKA